jgi:hypothetical protein
MREFIEKLLAENPELRPSMEKLVSFMPKGAPKDEARETLRNWKDTHTDAAAAA